jgi:hypothetical protein
LLSLGTPCITSSFTLIQQFAGNGALKPDDPLYPKNDGEAPLLSIYLLICVSSFFVLIPGTIISPAVLSAPAAIFPALRINSISRADFILIIIPSRFIIPARAKPLPYLKLFITSIVSLVVSATSS